MLKRMASAVYLGVRALFAPRSGGWPRERRLHLIAEPACQWCGGIKDLEVHHINPFHERPDLELDQTNMITLCMAPDLECHYRQGHKGESWLAFDPDIRRKCNERTGHMGAGA